MTPLMTASHKGHVDNVRLLVEAKAQLNKYAEVLYIAQKAIR